jgi:hypothetical protein
VVLSAQVLGWQTILVYPKFLHEYGSSESTFVPGHDPTLGMINLRGLLAPFVEGRLLFEVVSFINLAVWLPIFLCWRFADRQGKHAYQWVIALSVSATLFFSAHSLFYDFVMIAVGWAVTIDSDDINAPLRAARPWHLLWVATFWLLPALTWLLGALKVRYETSANLHALLLLYIACLGFIRLLQTRHTVPQTNAA